VVLFRWLWKVTWVVFAPPTSPLPGSTGLSTCGGCALFFMNPKLMFHDWPPEVPSPMTLVTFWPASDTFEPAAVIDERFPLESKVRVPLKSAVSFQAPPMPPVAVKLQVLAPLEVNTKFTSWTLPWRSVSCSLRVTTVPATPLLFK